ncbi:MAG: DPP IV N-terminal domain-containing protein [Planctomycetota bacterium]
MNRVASLACAAITAGAIATQGDAMQPDADLLAKAEARLGMLYGSNELRTEWFSAEWLADSSGYVVTEWVPEFERQARVLYGVEDGARTVLDDSADPGTARDSRVSPDGRRRIELDGGDVWVRDLRTDARERLTPSAVPDAVRTVFAAWSPDGTRIVLEQSDSSRVRKRSMLVPTDPSYPEVTETRFARVGEVIPSTRVGVITLESRAIRWIDLPSDPDGFYIGDVEWAGNSNEVLIEKFSRFRDRRDYFLADVRTGELKTIFSESDPAWVVASYETNRGLDWIDGHRSFVILSERDGWRRAFVYSRDGELRASLTPGEYDIIRRSHVDEQAGLFYFYASPDNATHRYLYSVRLDGSESPKRVSPIDQPGTHSYDISPDIRWAFHYYSSFDSPPVTDLIRFPEHEVVRTVEDNARLRERLSDMIPHPTEFLELEIDGGVTMDAWLMKPRDFDPTRRYPLLVHIYGEPHLQTVRDTWQIGDSEFHRVITELGYMVISIDNRGTPAPKGAAWRRAEFGRLGTIAHVEQAAAVKALAEQRPYVDLDRVGIWGWSGGGSNTLNAMFRQPETFHVGIAVAPKPQPHLYNAWFQEIYMETRETNPEGYLAAAPINFAEGLEGDLLIIHGTGERNTHIQITEGLVDRLIELGKPFDYMAYPNRGHGLFEGPGTTLHMRMLMVRYLLDHLPPGAR